MVSAYVIYCIRYSFTYYVGLVYIYICMYMYVCIYNDHILCPTYTLYYTSYSYYTYYASYTPSQPGNLLNQIISGLQGGGGLVTHYNTGFSRLQLVTSRYGRKIAVVKYLNRLEHINRYIYIM